MVGGGHDADGNASLSSDSKSIEHEARIGRDEVSVHERSPSGRVQVTCLDQLVTVELGVGSTASGH